MKMGSFLTSPPSSEFRTGDSGGDGDIEAFSSIALMETGDEQPPVHSLPDGLGNTVTLITHDDDALFCERLTVDVVAIEQSSINGVGGGNSIEEV